MRVPPVTWWIIVLAWIFVGTVEILFSHHQGRGEETIGRQGEEHRRLLEPVEGVIQIAVEERQDGVVVPRVVGEVLDVARRRLVPDDTTIKSREPAPALLPQLLGAAAPEAPALAEADDL